ncbi:abortive infection family protein [uncultured Maribacter sp.]|uniref:abortive infection family protein n=1 Tax=uncultured Maribacter sp. TaxID=431308 RepID=UPI00261E9006|nr:abortive infection family protein [uncultured Maribacter sp.]
MKQTKDILEQLEAEYSNIDYYNIIIDKIENNVNDNPDIAIESCKALLEGISKFIWNQVDSAYDSAVADKMDFHPLVRKSMNKLAEFNEDIEIDFVNKINKLIVSIGELRNRRGDISHGKLSPKDYFSDSQFSNLVMNITDNMLHYVLHCFSKVKAVKELAYEDNPEFNEKLDTENDFGFLSYSKALFEQDIVAYEQELQDYLETLELEEHE